jgi:uncharacterized protein (DUF3820 family)
MSSFQNVSTQGVRDVLTMLAGVQSSDDHDALLLRFKAEIEKRERMTEGGEAVQKDEKWARLDEMPYGRYEGCKFSGIPVSYLEQEKVRLEGAININPTDEEKKVLATIKHTLKWKATKEPISKMPFGKHKGQPFDEISVGYIEWLLQSSEQGRPLDEDLKGALNESLDRRRK